jgi:hypothetical protein
MPSIFESVVRADDLLYCQFELVNLAVGSSAAGVPQLKRVAAGPAHIIVRLPPQSLAEQDTRGGSSVPSLPYQAGLSGPSRLTFRVPDSVNAIDYRLDALLAFLQSADLETADALTGLTTAIECPDRLLLVPQPSTRLAHRTAPFTSQSTAVTELWHSMLHDPAGGDALQLRPIPNPSDGGDRSFTTPLAKADRDAIIAHSRQDANPNVVASQLFRLTALGATMQLKGDWAPSSTITLAAWEQRAELGRDQHVRTVDQGYLFPFGHRAAVAKVTDRQLMSHSSGLRTAELVQTLFLTVIEPERSYENLAAYPAKGREMPFVRARIVSAPQQISDPAAPIAVDLLLFDRAGSHIDSHATVFFVAAGATANVASLAALRDRYQTMSVLPLGGQRVVMADDGSGGDTSLNVDSVNLGVKLSADLAGQTVPPFLPYMRTADARIPALEQMVGTVDPTPAAHRKANRIVFHDTYLRSGFPPGDTKGVFAKFAPIAGLAIPADRAGGLAAPKFPGIDGLSRFMGPVASVDGFVNGSTLDPTTLIGDAKLLGVIPLNKVIAAVTDGTDPFQANAARGLFDSVDNMTGFLARPVMTTVTTGSGAETRFVWKPRLAADSLPLPLLKSGAIDLILKGRITAGTRSPSSPAAFAVQGRLRNFALSLLGLVTVKFNSVQFASRSGSKVDVKLDIADVEFQGMLTFVDKLRELLPTKSLLGLPQVQTAPDGVTVRYAIPVPSVPLGAMNIENLTVSSSVSLPFVEGKSAIVQFALSQRDNPFQINISIFGGTGFFSLQAMTSNKLAVEAALEFGGVAELDLVVVRGGVHLLAGVYLSMTSSGGVLIEGHLRFGGYVDVLGLISVSIEFFLALTYNGRSLAGTGRLTVGVKLLFHSESFSFEVHREISAFGAAPAGSASTIEAAHPHAMAAHTASLAITAPLASLSTATRTSAMTSAQWESYCRAFA